MQFAQKVDASVRLEQKVIPSRVANVNANPTTTVRMTRLALAANASMFARKVVERTPFALLQVMLLSAHVLKE